MGGRAVGLALCLCLGACTPRPGEPGPARTRPPTPVFVAGEERGALEPCGCTRPQLGGIPRLGAAVRGAALLEDGDLVDGPGRQSEIKAETLLLALSDLGCRALAVGEKDLSLGLDFLRSAADLARFPLLGANLLDEHGAPVFAGHADFLVDAEPWRAIGVLEPALAPAFRVTDPLAAVDREVRSAPPGTRIVVLYHGREAGARRILAAHPGLAAVVYAHAGGDPVIRSPKLFTPGDRTRTLVRLGPPPEILELGPDWPDDPAMVRAIGTYVRRIREEDLLHRRNPLAPPGGGGYLGDAGCAACHATAATIHGKSRHARAIRPLAATGREIDPECVTCHVTGYGDATGFRSVRETPALARVGCEACHGPGRDHANAPAVVRLATDARAACSRCHQEETDPGFAFDRKWPSIRHR